MSHSGPRSAVVSWQAKCQSWQTLDLIDGEMIDRVGLIRSEARGEIYKRFLMAAGGQKGWGLDFSFNALRRQHSRIMEAREYCVLACPLKDLAKA